MGLTLYSEVGCTGTAVTLKEQEVNLSKAGVTFSVKSARVDGNPWILYSEERYKTFLAFLEEGSYGDLSAAGLPEGYRVASAKLKTASVGSPHVVLYNASNFKDDLESQKEVNNNGGSGINGHNLDGDIWWSNGEQRLGCIASGQGGVWAVTLDGSVMFREGTGQEGLGSTGTGWSTGMGKMVSLSVGPETVWGLNRAEEVFVRIGVTAADPRGKDWTKMEGSMKTVSVGPTGVVWAVDKANTVWRRLGAKASNALGTKWQSVTGRLQHISVGHSGIWGVSPSHEVMYRDGTYGLPEESEGTGWTKVDGMMVWVDSREDIVWGLTADGELWYRAGIDRNNPMGTNWFKLNTAWPASNVTWRLVAGAGTTLWGIDRDNKLLCRSKADKDNIEEGQAVSLYRDEQNFKGFNIQDKPDSFLVVNGGWVVYEKPNFKGRCLFHFDGDCFSNDPANAKGPRLKMWQDSIGSVRPIRGLDWMVTSVRVQLDWSQLQTSHQTEVVDSQSGKNNTFTYQPAPWDRARPVQASVRHSFTLSESVPGLAGAAFSLDGVPREGIVFGECGSKLETGADFRQELSGTITFQSDSQAGKCRGRQEVVRLPKSVSPMHQVTVSTVLHKGTLEMPLTATFTCGNKEWSLPGKFTSVDATNFKMEYQEVYLGESQRKISRV